MVGDPSAMNDRAVLTVAELAALCRCGRRQIYEAIQRGEVPGVVRIGRSIRISTAAIERWLAVAGDEVDGDT